MTTPNASARWITVLLMTLFSLMNYFDRNIMSIAGPGIMKEYGLAPTQIGTVYSAFLLAYAGFMIPGGYLADRIGPRRAIALVGFGTALFTAVTAWSATPGLGSLLGVLPAMLVVRFLMGLFSSPLYPACGRMNATLIAPAHLGRVQGIIIGASSLGGAIAPLLFQYLMGRAGWRMSFVIAGAATGALALAWVLLSARDSAPTPRSQAPARVSWGDLFTNRNLMLITASYSALGYFSYLFYYWIFYYFGEVRHMGAEQSAGFATLVFVVNGLMIPLGGLLSDRFGRRLVPIVGLTLSAILLIAGTRASGNWTTAILMAFSMGCASVCEGPFWAMAIRIGGAQAGAAGSILNTGANITGFIAPMLTPLIAAYAGWSWGLYFACAVVLLGAVACYLVEVPNEAPETSSPEPPGSAVT